MTVRRTDPLLVDRNASVGLALARFENEFLGCIVD
jgi:hypothetical protein